MNPQFVFICIFVIVLIIIFSYSKSSSNSIIEGYIDAEVDANIEKELQEYKSNQDTLNTGILNTSGELEKVKQDNDVLNTKYAALKSSFNNEIQKNKDSEASLINSVKEAETALNTDVKALRDQLHKIHIPIIGKKEEDAAGYIKNPDYMKDVPAGTFLLSTDNDHADKYWDGEELRDIDSKTITKEVVDVLFPVGSVMIRYDEQDPNNFKGFEHTKWKRFQSNYVITSTSTEPIVKTGSWISKTFQLLTEHIPSHTHTATTKESQNHKHTGEAVKLSTKESTQESGIDETTLNGAIVQHAHSGKTNNDGDHSHTYDKPNFRGNGGSWGSSRQVCDGWGTPDTYGEEAKHAHFFQTNVNEGKHTHVLDINHSHSLTILKSSKHAHDFTTNPTGGNKAHTHEIELPKLKCAVWYRES